MTPARTIGSDGRRESANSRGIRGRVAPWLTTRPCAGQRSPVPNSGTMKSWMPWNARTSSSICRVDRHLCDLWHPREKFDNRLENSNGVFSNDSKFAHSSFFALLRFCQVTAVVLASIVPTEAAAAELNSGVVPHILVADRSQCPHPCPLVTVCNQNVDKAFHSTPVVEVEAMSLSGPIG